MIDPIRLVVSLALDSVAVAWFAWVTYDVVTDRAPPNAGAFGALTGGLLLWALCSLLSEFPHAWGIGANLAGIAQLVPAVFVPGLWLVYVLGYTGRETGLTRVRIAVFVLLALPLVGAVATFSGDPTESAVRRSLASLVGTALLLLVGIYTYSVFIFLRYGWSHRRVSKPQLAVQIGAVSAPYAVGAIGDGAAVVDGVTGGLLLSGMLSIVAVRRYPVLMRFPKTPYVARSRVVEALQEAVIVIDWEGAVLDVNTAAERYLDDSAARLIATPLSAVVDEFAGESLSPGSTGTVGLQTADGRRLFQYTVSAVGGTTTAESADPIARAVVLRDITDRRTREQRLSVLTRVLRHNVRNTLDVILAHADHVQDESHRTAIRQRARDLESTSRKARAAEAVMTESSGEPSLVDLTAVVADVATEARIDHPACTVSVSTATDASIRSHRSVVRRLVAELVENALVHSEPAATVAITVGTATDGTPRIVVGDDGPGIPERERALLSKPSETPLEHGLGVGLWFVNWAVSQLGAELSFPHADETGTTVVVRFDGTATDDTLGASEAAATADET